MQTEAVMSFNTLCYTSKFVIERLEALSSLASDLVLDNKSWLLQLQVIRPFMEAGYHATPVHELFDLKHEQDSYHIGINSTVMDDVKPHINLRTRSRQLDTHSPAVAPLSYAYSNEHRTTYSFQHPSRINEGDETVGEDEDDGALNSQMDIETRRSANNL